MGKIILISLVCLLMSGCVMFKANSDGVWVGATWSDAGKAVSKALPQSIDDRLRDYVGDKYINPDVTNDN